MPGTDRPSASSLRRFSEQRAKEQRAAGRATAEKNAEMALEEARLAYPAARLEERSYALFEVLEAELEVLERRDAHNRPTLPATPGEPSMESDLPPRVVDANYWLLRLMPSSPPQPAKSPAPELCVDPADWLYVATSLWEAADLSPADANSISPYAGTWRFSCVTSLDGPCPRPRPTRCAACVR